MQQSPSDICYHVGLLTFGNGIQFQAVDDPLDTGFYRTSPEILDSLKAETINCLRKSLLSKPGTTHDLEAIAPLHPFIRSFYEIGTQIRDGLNSDILQHFVFKHFYTYVNAIFQSTRSSYNGEIMNVDSYIENRLNDSGTYPTLALFVYAYHLDLPEWILEHEKMQMLMRHISIMVSLENDVLSLNKELKSGHTTNNLVLLFMYHDGNTIQDAVDRTLNMVSSSYRAYNLIQTEFLESVPTEYKPVLDKLLLSFTECRQGLLLWSYVSKRYIDVENPGDKVEVVIGEQKQPTEKNTTS
ncbi:Alpha-muurolene synthase [Penicillium rolfsii]|nr:Alpha-muurolene synthase [Penicillium rolfsii]